MRSFSRFARPRCCWLPLSFFLFPALQAQVRDTTRQARDSLRRDAARRPSAQGDTGHGRGHRARRRGRRARHDAASAREFQPPSPYNGLRFRSIGPALTSGRVSDIAVHPRDKRTWYVAVASGGVWKTTNAGTTWTPIFDDEGRTRSAASPSTRRTRNVVWVGTGENNSQRSRLATATASTSRSTAGESWKNVGLKQSEHIGKILIDPRNSDIVYVAAQGPLWSPGGDRGLYKTTDGGKTWKKVLDGQREHRRHRRRARPAQSRRRSSPRPTSAAATSGRSSTAARESGSTSRPTRGATWKKLADRPAATRTSGRIGLAIAPANPDVVYAIVEAADKTRRLLPLARRRRELGAHERLPARAASVLQRDLRRSGERRPRVLRGRPDPWSPTTAARRSADSASATSTWTTTSSGSTPTTREHLLIGCDGGLYETFDRGQTWEFIANLPVTQFYHVDADNALPFYNVYGGTQDNFTLGGPSRTRTEHGITNADWFVTAGRRRLPVARRPEGPEHRLRRVAERRPAALRPARPASRSTSSRSRSQGEQPLRWNWDSPLIISPHANTRLYFASQRCSAATIAATSWKAVSPDLTRQIDRNKLQVMGRVWSVDAVAKNTSTSFYGNIVALAESPLKEGLLYVGTDDGLIQVTEDGGAELAEDREASRACRT